MHKLYYMETADKNRILRPHPTYQNNPRTITGKEVYRMPPSLQLQPEIITLEQYEALPEDRRVEVFDGVVYDMASPSQIHQTLSMELSNIIYNHSNIAAEQL